jgi:hypothetical protein
MAPQGLCWRETDYLNQRRPSNSSAIGSAL